MQITEEIKARRNNTREQALMLLDMVPVSDTDSKYNLLSSAAGYLNDPEIISKWIGLIALETDTRLQADMLQRIAAGGLQPIPDKDAFINLLSEVLQQNESRDIILPLLGRFSITNLTARQKLMDFYREHNNADTRRQILSWLLVPIESSAADIAFYNEILDETDTTNKLVLVNRLLLQDKMDDEQIAKLLRPVTPEVIKDMVLRFCFDRSIVLEKPLCGLILSDKNPLIRKRCIQLLAVHNISDTTVMATLLQTLQLDPDEAVRYTAMQIFAYSISLTPENIDYLCNCLLQEKNTDLSIQLLQLLAPYSAKNTTLSDALLSLLDKPLQAVIANSLYEILGRQLPVNLSMLDRFVAAYDKEQRDDAKAVILKAISMANPAGSFASSSSASDISNTSMNASVAWNDFYLKALQAPSPAIREWALRAITMIPLTPDNITAVAAAAPALLQQELNRDLRIHLARKISRIPQLSAETVAIFTRIIDHEPNDQLQSIATQVQEKAISHTGGSNINWEQWLYKADVTHETDGIFPHLWIFYEENPEMAKKILYACLNPANSNSLYHQGVSDVEILEFLMVNDGIDEQLVHYAMNKLLQADLGYEGMFHHYLLIIKSNPAVPELKTTLWQLLETRGNNIKLIQLDELLRMVWGSSLEAEFRQRMMQQQTVNGVLPFLKYLGVNNTWEPVPDLLKDVVKLPGIIEDENFRNTLKEVCRNVGMDFDTLMRTAAPPPTKEVEEGPGFAD
jgi:hypothetical protein